MQGLWFKNEVEDKTWECPSKMYMTGVEVKRGRREIGDRDTYDFKLQCSGHPQPLTLAPSPNPNQSPSPDLSP